VVCLGLIQDNRYASYLTAHLDKVAGMPAAAVTALKKVLIDAGPFAGHGVAFSARMAKMPFAYGFQDVVLGAYSNSMKGITITSAIVLFIAGASALLLMRDHKGSQDE
jgi:hypothetical protein